MILFLHIYFYLVFCFDTFPTTKLVWGVVIYHRFNRISKQTCNIKPALSFLSYNSYNIKNSNLDFRLSLCYSLMFQKLRNRLLFHKNSRPIQREISHILNFFFWKNTKFKNFLIVLNFAFFARFLIILILHILSTTCYSSFECIKFI